MKRRIPLVAGMMVLGSSTVMRAGPGGGCPCDADINDFNCGPPGPPCCGNGDGFVTADDANILIDCITGFSDTCVNGCGDVNCDGAVDLVDLAIIFCTIGGLCNPPCAPLDPIGACSTDFGCLQSTEFVCGLPAFNGMYQGDGTSCTPIPTVSEWGIVVMTLSFLTMATIVFRTRSAVPA